MKKKILNLGSWSWQNIPILLKRSKDITNVDISKKSLEACQNKFPKLKYTLSRCEDLDFSAESFDEIHAYDVLEHVTDLDKTMTNIHNFLKPWGKLFIEVPYEKSEKMLLKINPDYFSQIWHKRIFTFQNIRKTFEDYWFQVLSIKKERWIANLYLFLIFKLWINITDEMCNVSGKLRIVERMIMWFCIWFDKNILNTRLKYIPIYIITLPIWWVISQIYPKTISIICKK